VVTIAGSRLAGRLAYRLVMMHTEAVMRHPAPGTSTAHDAPRTAHGLDARWAALAARDARADGTFVYAVTSTGVYCRPSCPSRRPRADRVRFFDSGFDARTAGFRACKRCRPDTVGLARPGVDAVRRVSAWLAAHADETVTLARLARLAAMSPHHLQRRFTSIVGVSPREFQAACRAGRLRSSLRRGGDVTSAIYEAGYGSPSRVYEGVASQGMAPSVYRKGGLGMRISYSLVPSPLGRLLVASTELGVCAVKLGEQDDALERELKREYPAAEVVRDRRQRREWVEAIVGHLRGGEPSIDLPIDVRATAFQWKVWRALQTIPYGQTRAYADVARSIGQPRAVRAVARACATNPVALVVPCHRVVQTGGGLGGYRWGVRRKAKLLEKEGGRRSM
jgi:AraC family transcriptional regulator of adaptative response/methylated-DNA-[protein]-cysteine methyltransferase